MLRVGGQDVNQCRRTLQICNVAGVGLSYIGGGTLMRFCVRVALFGGVAQKRVVIQTNQCADRLVISIDRVRLGADADSVPLMPPDPSSSPQPPGGRGSR